MESTSNTASARNASASKNCSARVGIPGPINELDPRKAVDYVSGIVLDQIFEPPYAAIAGRSSADPRLLEPLRAEGARKGLEYSAGIRQGIRFSNGTPLTAELAAQSLRGAAVLHRKAKIDLRGDRVWFTLSVPNPRFDLTLTQGGCSIVFDDGHQLWGTGPYMFDARPNLRSLQQSPRLRLVRNPHDHRTAHIDELEFHVLRPESDGTPRALVDAMRSGSIDLTTALSTSDVTTGNITGVVPVVAPSNSTAFLYINTVRHPLDTAAARRGIAAIVDRFEIAAKSYDRNPAAFVATGTLPPSMSRSAGTFHTSSVDGARLMQESGLRGARLSLLLPWSPRPYLVKPMAVAQILQKRLADAGVTLSLIETTSSEDYFELLCSGRFDLALGGWIADNADPADYFEALLSSHVVGNRNFANHSRWIHPATDKLLERFRVDPSDEHRREIEQIVAEEVPYLPLVYGQSCVVHGRRIRNVTVTPTGSLSLVSMTAV